MDAGGITTEVLGTGEPMARWSLCCRTLTGPAHQRAGLPNQDSSLPLRTRHSLGVVVCDGLGSAPHAETGSIEACHAVADSLRLWRGSPQAKEEHLIRLIHLIWAMRIGPHPPRDYATTCLLATIEADGQLLLGQLGDGAILIEGADGKVSKFVADDDKWGGITTGLGVATSITEWTLVRLPSDTSRFIIVATDGVADDLIPDQLEQFASYLKTEILAYPPRRRLSRLERMLAIWPTPGHWDDKTIAVLWRSDAAGLGEQNHGI